MSSHGLTVKSGYQQSSMLTKCPPLVALIPTHHTARRQEVCPTPLWQGLSTLQGIKRTLSCLLPHESNKNIPACGTISTRCGKDLFGDWFDHVLEWWNHRDAEDILFQKYVNMKDCHAKIVGYNLKEDVSWKRLHFRV